MEITDEPLVSEEGSFCLIPGAGATWDQKLVAQAHNLSTETSDIDVKSYDFLILATNATEKIL